MAKVRALSSVKKLIIAEYGAFNKETIEKIYEDARYMCVEDCYSKYKEFFTGIPKNSWGLSYDAQDACQRKLLTAFTELGLEIPEIAEERRLAAERKSMLASIIADTKYEEDHVAVWIKSLFRSDEGKALSNDDLYNWSTKNLDLKTEAEESISMSMHTSLWSETIEGTATLFNGKVISHRAWHTLGDAVRV